MNSYTSNPDEAENSTGKSMKKNIPGLALLLLDLAVALVGFYIGTHFFWKDQNEGGVGYRPKCVSVLACVPLWQWAFLLFELYGRGTRGRPECVSGMAGQALRHNG